ncbi:MAG: hypothetical protein NTU84_04545, partial [Verrucomicrobia bacterium]|nr:hypothetical protein [Verrucomicrobiota bacterium]
ADSPPQAPKRARCPRSLEEAAASITKHSTTDLLGQRPLPYESALRRVIFSINFSQTNLPRPQVLIKFTSR